MPALLDKSYAHALLFSIGLVLGGSQEPQKKPVVEVASTTAQPQASRPVVVVAQPAPAQHTGAESDELSLLRRAESELFADVPSRTREPSGLATGASFACSDRASGPFPRFDRNLAQGEPETTGAWTGLRMPAFAVRQDTKVDKYVRYFSQSRDGRNIFTTWLRRSGRYAEVISASLKQHKVPLDLIAVAFIESGFGPTAVSSAGATGMWQFMAGTARAYGLVVDSAIDERRSVWRSTDAAARHLADLYEYFRSWDLALAAYNYGYKGLSSRIEQAGTEDFWSLAEIPGALPRETVLYVPKVLAVAVILNNLEAFGFGTVSLDQPLEVAEVEVPAGVRLSILARSAGTSLAKIRSLNPEFRKDATPERGGPVRAHIPASGLARSGVMLSRLIEQADQDVTDVKVSPDFDWGRDDMTDWRARLSQDEEAGKARTEVPTAMLSVSTSDNRSEPRSSCELPRSEVTSQQFSGALPTADSTSRAAAPPEAPRPKWAPRSPLVKPPAAMRALRNKVSRMRHDRKGAGTPEPTRTAGLGAARQPVDGKQSHAAGVYERLKKTVAN